MARYRPVDYAQGQFISIQFDKQILPGTFEHHEGEPSRPGDNTEADLE